MRTTLKVGMFVLVSLVGAAAAQAQVWEKYLAPGLTYRMEVDSDIPRTIHALHFDLHSDAVKVVPELGQGKVYNDDKTKGRATVSAMVKRVGALAGINASFFPYTGRPVGLMVRDGELISSPYKTRPEFGWGPNQYAHFATSTFSASYKSGDSQPVSIDTVNEEAPPDTTSLDTDTGGWAFARTGTGTCAILHVLGDKLVPNGDLEAEVVDVKRDVSKMPIPKGEAVIMGTGSQAAKVGELKPGDRVVVSVHIDGFEWDKLANAVCGGPVLLRNGNPVIDWEQEGFKENFAMKRYPRTAVGIDTHGDLWLVSVDGLLPESSGASLGELAAIMLRFGCRDAINLDGGGSTTVNVLGVTVNRPGDGVERELANAILFLGPTGPKDDAPLSLRAPEKLKLGDKTQISVAEKDGERVPDGEILWSATGGGWIDQGGLLHVDKAAPVELEAYVHGQTLSATIAVES